MEEISVIITKTRVETPLYMVNVYVNGKWHKEIGPFSDPALALEETAKSEDLKNIMRPDSF